MSDETPIDVTLFGNWDALKPDPTDELDAFLSADLEGDEAKAQQEIRKLRNHLWLLASHIEGVSHSMRKIGESTIPSLDMPYRMSEEYCVGYNSGLFAGSNAGIQILTSGMNAVHRELEKCKTSA